MYSHPSTQSPAAQHTPSVTTTQQLLPYYLLSYSPHRTSKTSSSLVVIVTIVGSVVIFCSKPIDFEFQIRRLNSSKRNQENVYTVLDHERDRKNQRRTRHFGFEKLKLFIIHLNNSSQYQLNLILSKLRLNSLRINQGEPN